MFQVMQGIKKEKPDYYQLYLNAYIRKVEQFRDNPGSIRQLKQIIFYAIKTVNAYGSFDQLDQDGAANEFLFVESIKELMKVLTPNDLIKMFPIDKTYDGDRWECKDYFYTMNALTEHGLNKPFGDRLDHILWDYENRDMRLFVVNTMGIIDRLRRLQGEPGVMEEWLEKRGVETYTLHTDQSGKQYFHSRKTGKTMRVKRKKPRYLRSVH